MIQWSRLRWHWWDFDFNKRERPRLLLAIGKNYNLSPQDLEMKLDYKRRCNKKTMQSSSSGASCSSRLTAALLSPHMKVGFGFLQVIYHPSIHSSTHLLSNNIPGPPLQTWKEPEFIKWIINPFIKWIINPLKTPKME